MAEQQQSQVCPLISPTEVSARAADLVLLDVRSPIEFETEHISGALNVPLDELDKRCEEVPRQGELIVICRSGKRAERAAYTLLGRGLNPKVMAGGLLAWRQHNLPVQEGKRMFPIERQIQLIVGLGVLTGVCLGVFVNQWFLIIPAFFGAGLTFAGASGTCALGLLLMKAPWNRLPSAQKRESCCS